MVSTNQKTWLTYLVYKILSLHPLFLTFQLLSSIFPHFIVFFGVILNSMFTHCQHSEGETPLAATLAFDWVQVTVMPAGSHKKEILVAAKGHSAVCVMLIPFTAWKHTAL